jgi:hypothetical protein
MVKSMAAWPESNWSMASNSVFWVMAPPASGFQAMPGRRKEVGKNPPIGVKNA